MKYEIYGESTTPEKPVRLKLVEFGDGVAVVAVDEQGNVESQGYLITFTPDGKLRRCVSVGNFGFQLDSSGRISED